jgi:hypothetical protein
VAGHEDVILGGVGLAKSAPEWLLRNLLFHFIGALGTPCLSVRYESLLARPVAEVGRIVAFSGSAGRGDEIKGLTDTEYESKLWHTVGGNRIRFLRGRIQLRVDEEWRTRMKRRDRLLVSIMTFPLLVKYGYVGYFGRDRGGRDRGDARSRDGLRAGS